MCIRDRVSDLKQKRNVFCSQSIEKMLGWTQNDFINGGWAFAMSLTHPDDAERIGAVSYTHLRAHETVLDLVCRLLLEKKKETNKKKKNKKKQRKQYNTYTIT